MAKQMDPKLAERLKAVGVTAADAWDCHGTWVIYHRALERAAAAKGIRFDPPVIVEADGASKIAALCVTGHLGDKTEWSIGEAAPGNNKNAYPWAMAEKRAKDRVILKLFDLHGEIYSEDEADDFKAQTNGTGERTDAPPSGSGTPPAVSEKGAGPATDKGTGMTGKQLHDSFVQELLAGSTWQVPPRRTRDGGFDRVQWSRDLWKVIRSPLIDTPEKLSKLYTDNLVLIEDADLDPKIGHRLEEAFNEREAMMQKRGEAA